MQFRRKDIKQIWYMGTTSIFCIYKDKEFFAVVPGKPESLDLGLVLRDDDLKIVIDGGYTNIDYHFLSQFDRNLTIAINSKQSTQPMFLTFQYATQDEQKLIGTMRYKEEVSAGQSIRSWIFYIGSLDIVFEGYRASLYHSIFCLVLVVMIIEFSIFFPFILAMRTALIYIGVLTLVWTFLPMMIFDFGYMASFLTIILSSFFITRIVSRLPTFVHPEYIFTWAVAMLYLISQYKYIMTFLLVITIEFVAIGTYWTRFRVISPEQLAQVFGIVLLVTLHGINFFQSPYICFQKVLHHALSYENHGGYTKIVWYLGFGTLGAGLLFGLVGIHTLTVVERRKIREDRLIANHKTLGDSPESILARE